MDPDQLRGAVAGLVIFFIAWIGFYAIYASLKNRTPAIAVTPRRATGAQKVLLLTAFILDTYLIARAWNPSLDSLVLTQPTPAPLLAVALMAAGGGLMIATHLHMGASWRIGVPEGGGDIDALVTTGPHRLSRNPIYLGILVMIVGATLAAPGPLTLSALAATFIGLQSIIAEEEAYLSRQFGDTYSEYRARVRRWI